MILEKEIFNDKFHKLSKISMQMSNLNISPSKADKYGIKIAKDGVFRISRRNTNTKKC